MIFHVHNLIYQNINLISQKSHNTTLINLTIYLNWVILKQTNFQITLSVYDFMISLRRFDEV